MDHRDAPRIVPAEDRPRDARDGPGAVDRRLTRFVSLPTERRPILGRLGMALAAIVLAILVFLVVGSKVVESLVRWLHNQPQYQTTFQEIELDPPPPDWFRGGKAVFLDCVRREARRDDVPFSALDLSLAELDREFRLFCWVKRVRRVERLGPNRIRVRLDYRIPVGRPYHDKKPGHVLFDEDGVMLPVEDLDPERAGALIRIEGLDPPVEPKMGSVWKIAGTAHGFGQAHEGVQAAAKLAAFLKATLSGATTPIPPELQPVAIHIGRSLGGKYSIWVENPGTTFILWTGSTGLETPGQRTVEQKWSDLQGWFTSHPGQSVQKPYYLDLSDKGIEIKKDPRGNLE